ncbi:contact-dependent growth inhibition system immunity protein [Hymenobacter sp. YC55]|uniref:contact-dependent growth inhibition system immunity protein n=1 Tax=Hymenobacter sp. YC55 TaxID=3034019 RepID=UPI0023F88FD4|nr:contact-dependent growth inhibition system immunity protein [Hymenobacter sp. YC55]MDF7810910.1 contact-dependent growth inhibition system immunity protein [Hymenobacter sp. YC55]
MKDDLNKSINELEGAESELDSNQQEYPLARRCSELREKPLKNYTVEDLRLMIGQGIGLSWLVPVAIEKLAENLFSEGDFYPGDLLINVLRIETNYWITHARERAALLRLLEEKLPFTEKAEIPKSVLKAIETVLTE